jgi:hypothetical protein
VTAANDLNRFWRAFLERWMARRRPLRMPTL